MTNKSSIGLTAALLAAILVGCGEKEETPVSKPETPVAPVEQKTTFKSPVEERMNDPEYVKSLDTLKKQQQEIVAKLQKARAALEQAKAEGAGEAKIAELQAAVDRCVKKFEASRTDARRVVARRMNASIAKTENGFKQEGK